MNEKTEKILNFDALSEAERITGHSYKSNKFVETLGFLLHVEATQEKERHLKEIGDTRFSMPWDEFKKLIHENGFEILLCDQVEGYTSYDEEPYCQEEFIIAIKNGIVLKAESYRGKTVNSANIYFNAKVKDPASPYHFPHCGGKTIYIGKDADARGFAPCNLPEEDFYRDSVMVGDFDAREGMLSKLADLEENTVIVLPWIEVPYMWLISYGESNRITAKYGNSFSNLKFEEYDCISRERFCRAGLPDIVKMTL